jgi:ketosteroid isomerase-like protein
MPDIASRDPARDPQDLEQLLVQRQRAGDIEGMMALYEPEPVVDTSDGEIRRGKDAIRAYFASVIASGRQWQFGQQQPALISGDLALTSTRTADGRTTAEVARRQADGTWLWVLDRFTHA